MTSTKLFLAVGLIINCALLVIASAASEPKQDAAASSQPKEKAIRHTKTSSRRTYSSGNEF